ncbi:hypothetical protein VP01_68g10 [Puccinia sorghi]|uniref:Uncharacterized protein n=1 Tax=Puccinia sorghi TaxID=27349 RepID=A0A0L6UE87_9BASI|nr:hypothetical protein VP01_68g10 [Puccinia sorghi]
MLERKISQGNNLNISSCTSSCPHIQYRPQCHYSLQQMYSLGWQKGYESPSKAGISAKVAKDPEGYCQLQTHLQHNALNALGLEPKLKEAPNGFTCHLSFTITMNKLMSLVQRVPL